MLIRGLLDMNHAIKYLIPLLCLAIYPPTLYAEDIPHTIKIEAEAWPRATEVDGRGMYWDIIRKIYEPEGVKVELGTSTYTRSVGLMKSGEVDAMVGAYANEIEGALYAKSHFDTDVVAALFKKNSVTWQGEASLKGKHIASIKGYQLSDYISVPFKVHEYRDRKEIIRLLDDEKIDFFVDAQMDIQEELKKSYIPKNTFQLEIVKQLKVYIVFCDNDRGKYLRDMFDQRFNSLLQEGEIKRIFDKWNWPLYPF